MTIKNETTRYDKEEDRANDVKKHDNPNHESYFTYLRNLSLSDWEEYEEPERDEEVEEIVLEE